MNSLVCYIRQKEIKGSTILKTEKFTRGGSTYIGLAASGAWLDTSRARLDTSMPSSATINNS